MSRPIACITQPAPANDELDVTRPALRYHGGKFRLAAWLMQFFPAHETYTEAFGGAAGVLIQKPRSKNEVYNDLDGDVVNFFRVLRDRRQREELIEACLLTPYARDEFALAWEPCEHPVERARRTAIRAQMGFGSAGATKGATGFRINTQREYTSNAWNWASYPQAIAAAGERLQGVLIENRTAVEVLVQHDTTSSLHFVDPPYVRDTRVLKTQAAYRHEMTNADHQELLECLLSLKGYVVLCSYEHELYAGMLKGWKRFETQARAAGHKGSVMRTEVVWINPACDEALHRNLDLFRHVEPVLA